MLEKHFYLVWRPLDQTCTGANIRKPAHLFIATMILLFITRPQSLQFQQRTHFHTFTSINKINPAPHWIQHFEGLDTFSIANYIITSHYNYHSALINSHFLISLSINLSSAKTLSLIYSYHISPITI